MPQGTNGRDLTLTRDGANPIGTIPSAASAIDTRSPTFTSSWVVRERAHVEAHGSVKAKIPEEAKGKSVLVVKTVSFPSGRYGALIYF
jgi:mRNA degradation ribonuclease J1/J2